MQLLHLIADVTNASDSNIPSIHSAAMFKAAVLLATQYNMSIQGKFIGGQIADTAGTATNAMMATCRVISASNIAGIVGPKYSRETPIIAGLSQQIGIPVISHSATDPALSDRNAYPTFYRTVPSDSAAALAIVQLFLDYNWTSCIIIYQNDAFGLGGEQAITNAFLKHNLVITENLVFDIVTLRTRDNLKDVLTSSSTRIIVLWITSPFVVTILRDALNSDVLGPNYVWIISSNFDLSNFNQTEYSKLLGLLTLEPTVASVTNAPINITLLNTAFALWKQYEPETFPGPDDVDYYALFTFDATWTLIQVLQQFCSINNRNSSCIALTNATYCFDRHLLDSDALFDLINNITFLGVTGHIQFNPNTTDRINGSYYVAKNVQYSSKTLNFVQVLSYSDLNGWQRNALTQLIWPGNSLVVPSGNAKLEGIKLRLVLIPSVQYTNVINVTDPFGNTSTQLIGYIPDLINLLQAKLKFIPDIHVVPGDRTYNSLVDDVVNNIYDLVVADLTVTATRSEKVDFSNSIFDNSLRIIMRAQPDIQIELFSFLKPLSWDLWLLMIGTLIFTSILICIVEREANNSLRKKSFIVAYATIIWYAFCSFMGRDVKLEPKTLAGRLLSTAMFFLTLVIVASYTANLASQLTISKSKSVITGIDDIKNGKLPFNRIGIMVGTAQLEYFLTEISGGNPNYYPLYSIDDMYQRLLSGAIDVALMDTGNAEYMTNNVYCNLTLIGDGFNKGTFAIAMRKQWLYEKDLDVAILSIRESGTFDGLYRKWFQYKTCSEDSVPTDAIDSRSVIGLFMLFGIVCALSLFIFIWGKLHVTKRIYGFIHRIIESWSRKRSSTRENTTRSSQGFQIREIKPASIQQFRSSNEPLN